MQKQKPLRTPRGLDTWLTVGRTNLKVHRALNQLLGELEQVQQGTSAEELLDAWLQTPDFAQQVVRHHRSLLWPNVSDIRLLSNRQRLVYRDGILLYQKAGSPTAAVLEDILGQVAGLDMDAVRADLAAEQPAEDEN